jgi:hypothetical protein
LKRPRIFVLAGVNRAGSGAVLLMVVLPTLVIKRFTGAALSAASDPLGNSSAS